MQDTLTKPKLPDTKRLDNPWRLFDEGKTYRFMGQPAETNGPGSALLISVCEVHGDVNCNFSTFIIDQKDMPAKTLPYERRFIVLDGRPRPR